MPLTKASCSNITGTDSYKFLIMLACCWMRISISFLAPSLCLGLWLRKLHRPKVEVLSYRDENVCAYLGNVDRFATMTHAGKKTFSCIANVSPLSCEDETVTG